MAKPSSSTSRLPPTPAGAAPAGEEPPARATDREWGSGLFGFMDRGEIAAQVSDRAWLQAMLDFEAALARAEGRAGVVPPAAADAIAAACLANLFDADAIGAEASRTGNPAAPLVAALTAAVAKGVGGDAVSGGAAGPGPEAAGYVHFGATSQDVMDTAAMLVSRRAATSLLLDLGAAAEAAARLARRHRDTLMTGRTLLQQALPTTFGMLAATWLGGLDRAAARLRRVAATGLAVQLGGAVGTLASLGDAGEGVLGYVADELELVEPDAPWHTERTRIAELATALGEVAGAAAKIATDVALLSQSEIGEVREGVPGRGGSSTMPQKRNAVAAIAARACAARTPGLVATLLAAMPQELQRGAGTWQSEWLPLSDLWRAAGAAVAWIRDCLENLEVDADRMRANVASAGPLLLAEHVVTELTPRLGRLDAHRLVESAAQDSVRSGRPFAEAIVESLAARSTPDGRRFDRGEIERWLDGSGYLGSAGRFVDRALAAHESGGLE